ncbi:MAG TPA: hypothetical protein VK464_22945 [Symbiobacteriaceae bacterium]|jgi:hypothetical protein|nr:hypothetical protein [Symbiobacteriaceae bacterium]
MKKGLALVCMLMMVMGLATTAGAEYRSDQDVTIDLSAPVSVAGDSTAATSFETQEAAHEAVTETTGTSVDHSYVWVSVNGDPLLAVDPLCIYEVD